MDTTPYIGTPYKEGRDDCYGLLRRCYRKEYDLRLSNYARPGDFAYSGLDLLQKYFQDEGFKIVNVSTHRMDYGDVALMHIGAVTTANHIAIYAGAQRILHHLVDDVSRVTQLDVRWRRRIMTILRHPDVEAMNHERREATDPLDLIPPHMRVRHVESL